jgi:hypothetical protein
VLKYTDRFKKNKYFTVIPNNTSLVYIMNMLTSINADISLNDFILLVLYKTNKNINTVHLEFFKQLIVNKYKLSISSNELIIFNLIRKAKHLEKYISRNFRFGKDYNIIDKHVYSITGDIFKHMLAQSVKHKDLFLTYVYLEECIHHYNILKCKIFQNVISIYKDKIKSLKHENDQLSLALYSGDESSSDEDSIFARSFKEIAF